MTLPGPSRLRAAFLRAFPATLFFPCSLHAFPAPTSPPPPAPTTSGTAFEKGASRFCFESLPAADQKRYYGRLVNLGASFTHGCVGCDAKTPDAQSNELTGDAAWIRRHYLAHFFTRAKWKSSYDRAQGVFVLENDPQNKPRSLVPPSRLANGGYSGVWHWNGTRDDVQLLSREETRRLLASTRVLADAPAVGGWEHRADMSLRPGGSHGVLFSAYAQEGTGYRPIHDAIDFAVDGGRMQDLFRVLGAGDLLPALENSGWAAGPVRDEAVRRVVERISSTRPGAILAIDILFWDSIARTLSFAREDGTDSLVLRFLIATIERTPKGREFFDQARMAGVRSAFYQVLERVSRGDDGRGGTLPSAPPLLLARLLDDGAAKLRARGYEPIIAALLGEFVSRFTGRNIAGDMVDWLRSETAPSGRAASPAIASWAPRLTPGERVRARKALAALDERNAKDPTGRDDASGLPRAVQGVATWLLLDVLKESGALLDDLGRAMDETNAFARAITASRTNNVHLVDADEFFLNFGAFLKPQTMHPSVAGARRMAEMLSRSICSSTEAP